MARPSKPTAALNADQLRDRQSLLKLAGTSQAGGPVLNLPPRGTVALGHVSVQSSAEAAVPRRETDFPSRPRRPDPSTAEGGQVPAGAQGHAVAEPVYGTPSEATSWKTAEAIVLGQSCKSNTTEHLGMSTPPVEVGPTSSASKAPSSASKKYHRKVKGLLKVAKTMVERIRAMLKHVLTEILKQLGKLDIGIVALVTKEMATGVLSVRSARLSVAQKEREFASSLPEPVATGKRANHLLIPKEVPARPALHNP